MNMSVIVLLTFFIHIYLAVKRKNPYQEKLTGCREHLAQEKSLLEDDGKVSVNGSEKENEDLGNEYSHSK